MNVQQEGLGLCQKCGTPIMQAINQPGVKGMCFGCSEDGKPKTGHTTRVASETGTGLAGRVELEELEHSVGAASHIVHDVDAVRKAIAEKAKGVVMPTAVVEPPPNGELTITVSIEELLVHGITTTLLQLTYDAIDNMPPCATLRETKKAIRLQEDIDRLLKAKGDTDAK